MRDAKAHSDVLTPLVPLVRTASANGVTVDMLGAKSALFVFNVGAVVAAGNQTPKLQHGDLQDGSDAVDVAATDQNGSLGVLVQDTPQRVSYIGSKRYVRPVITHNSGTSVATGVTVVREMNTKPTA
jgi:hypothetical protein